MKVYHISKYGEPEKVLILKEVDKPIPKKNEVLIKVCSTSINDYDWSIVRGKPYIFRLMFGLFRPKKKFQIAGMELSGIIKALGTNIKRFKLGDEVYGDISSHGFGSFAEYICIDEKALEIKPDKMSFEEAASIPHATMLALQGLRDVGKIKEGQKILINGGGGGVGTFGLQIAKLYKSEVTGVDTGEKLQKMKELGFDHIIDYKEADFTRKENKYDLILDCKTNHSPFDYLHVLNPNGKYVTIGGQMSRIIQLLFLNPFISMISKKRMFIVSLKPNRDLDYINKLYLAGQIKCIIDGPYTLENVPSAIQFFGEGKHFGKVVISIN